MLAMNSNTAIVTYGSEERAIDAITHYCSQNEFPFSRYFSASKSQLYALLKAYQPVYVDGRYFLCGYGSRHKLFMPPTYGGSYTIPHSHDDYDRIDVLLEHYVEDLRIQCAPSSDDPSLYEVWKSEELLTSVVARTLRFPEVSLRNLRISLGLEYSEVPAARLTQMKSLLNLLIDYTNSEPPSILDLNSEWGSRLLAAISLNCNYMGYNQFEIRSKRLQSMIADFGNSAKHRVATAKIAEIPNNGENFNIVILEPGEKKKSIDWIVNEFFLSIIKGWNCLKNNGKMAIIVHDEHDQFVCEAMNLFIEQLIPNSSYEGVIGLQADTGKIYPIWVWAKKEHNKIIWNPPISKRQFWMMYPALKEKLIIGQIKGLSLDLYTSCGDRKRKINYVIAEIIKAYPRSNWKQITNILSEGLILTMVDKYDLSKASEVCIEILRPWFLTFEQKPLITDSDKNDPEKSDEDFEE